MKSFLLILISAFSLSPSVNAQDLDSDEGENFWARYIDPILLYDLDQVVDQTSFPIATYEGDLNEEDFLELYEIIFDEATIDALSYMDYTAIKVLGYDENTIYQLSILTEFEIDEEYYESATILSFRQENGSWKMFQIDIAG